MNGAPAEFATTGRLPKTMRRAMKMPDVSVAAVLELSRDRRIPEAVDRARELLASCGADERRIVESCKALVDWRAAADAGRQTEGLIEAIAGISLLEDAGYRPLLGWVYASVGFSLGLLGDFERGLEWCEIGIEDAQECGDHRLLIVAYGNKGALLGCAEELDRASECFSTVLSLCEREPNITGVMALSNLSYCQILRAQRNGTPGAEASELAQRALQYAVSALESADAVSGADAQRLAHVRGEVLCNQGNALCLLGRFVEAEAAFTQGLRMADSFPQTEVELAVSYAGLVIETGRYTEAAALLDRAAANAQPELVDRSIDRILELRIKLAHLEGRSDDAEAVWRERLQLAQNRYRNRLRNLSRHAEFFAEFRQLRRSEQQVRAQAEDLHTSEEALRAARDKLQATLDALPDLMFEVGPDGAIRDYHSSRDDLLAAPREAILGKKFTDLIPSEVAHVVAAALDDAASNGVSRGRSYALQLPSGVHWFELSVAAKARKEDHDRSFIVLARDVTERKRAEDVERAASANIRKLSRALEQVAESIVITNLAAEIEYVNDAFLQVTGYRRDEVIGQNPRFLRTPKTPPATYAALWDALIDGRTWRGEFHNRRKDGSEYIESAVISPMRGIDGCVTHYVAAKMDITRAKQLEEDLRQAKAAAEFANLAKSRFMASMSHEIRTPMNGILGMAQVLLVPNISEAERLDYARTILGSGQTLLTLLNDILDISKIEAGKVDLEAVAFEPGQIIGEVRGLFAEIARGKGLRIETDWSRAPRRYVGDPHRLRQMLSNLVGNAVKFTAQGQIRIEASEIRCNEGTAVLEFSVADSGIGIAPSEQRLLFQPFSQADSSITRSYGGSGLGLSIVASFARLMGGDVGVESEAGHGSRFWFRIRAGLAAGDIGEAQPSPRAGTVSSGVATRFSGRVLVVEDHPGNRAVIGLLLRKLGLGAAFAVDGRQALDVVIQGEPADLILMDVQMPRMDGYGATEGIRCWEKETGQRRRPIVALTADAFVENRRRCLAAGMDDVLTKPIAFDALVAALDRWLPATAPAADAPALPAAAGKSVDVARVAALVEELLPLLARNSFDAIGHFRALQEAVAGTALAAEIDETGCLLKTMRFDLALEHLRRMAATYAWEESA